MERRSQGAGEESGRRGERREGWKGREKEARRWREREDRWGREREARSGEADESWVEKGEKKTVGRVRREEGKMRGGGGGEKEVKRGEGWRKRAGRSAGREGKRKRGEKWR